MSLLRSPTSNDSKFSSQPDLSRMEEEFITSRKRKQPDHDCDCKNEIKALRSDLSRMNALLEKFVISQEQTMNAMRDNISEINGEIKDIKASTSAITMDQNNIKGCITELSDKISIHEHKLTSLESDLKTLQASSTTPSETLHLQSSEQAIYELRERLNREKNIILTGLPEHRTSDSLESRKKDEMEIMAILTAIFRDCPKPTKIFRLGKYAPDKNRRIKVCFQESQTAKFLLRNKSKLPEKIKMFSDQTPSQQKYFNEIKNELARRQDNGEIHLSIKYVKGVPTIVQNKPKNSELPHVYPSNH